MRSLLLIYFSMLIAGCLPVCRSKGIPVAQQGLETPNGPTYTFLEDVVYHRNDDGPQSLIELNKKLEVQIEDTQNQVNAFYQKYISDAQNAYAGAEFSRAQDLWVQLREQDSLLAARGEHGPTLTRYLYLTEKLRLTEERLKYIKKVFNDPSR